MTVRATPGMERGDPFDRDMLVCGSWPVPQLGARVYELVARARDGDVVPALARDFAISELEVVLLCLHHRVGPKGGAKYFVDPQWRPRALRGFVDLSQPTEAS